MTDICAAAKPVYYLLADEFECQLLDAQHLRAWAERIARLRDE